MILADKIIKLRRQFGWSQEELAEKMNVSRQSVSKWESANSIPDLNKIIKLGEIFGVSTDYLIKDEIEDVESISEDSEPGVLKVTLEQATDYIQKKIEMSKLIARGVLIVMNSVIPLLFLLGLSDGGQISLSSNVSAAIGLVSLFVMVALAVSIFLRANQYESEFNKLEKNEFELVYGVRSIIKEKLDSYKSSYTQKMSIGVMMFILSVVPLLLAALLDGSGLMVLMMVIVMILMVALGVFYIVPVSAKYNAYSLLVSENEYAPEKKEETKRMEKVASVYWPLVTAVYIGWSLWTMAWGTTWIVWPVAAIAFAGLVGLMSLFDSTK